MGGMDFHPARTLTYREREKHARHARQKHFRRLAPAQGREYLTVEKIATKSGMLLLVEKRIIEDWVEVSLRAERHEKCLLHWGLRLHSEAPWQSPPQSVWPEGSQAFDGAAVQTPFLIQNGGSQIIFRLDRTLDFSLIEFVLFFPEEDRWDNNRGINYRIKVPTLNDSALDEADVTDDLASEIIEKEMSGNSWTLMHRFNLCYDLLDKVRCAEEGLVLIFVWLRFSSIRQLDWQRNYNTTPRELSHALDRLTLKLADRYVNDSQGRNFIRLILTTMGRGGEGQRIRDEVLNIMHRHHIKEVSGHFMEEWHQKLHNNTTPDDVVICEAYLKFLRSEGDLDVFYETLKKSGVSGERLRSYERPIISHPDFIPHLKEALIHDFEHFLELLKAVHSGTDLGTAIHAAKHLFDSDMQGLMDFIWWHRGDDEVPVWVLVEKITEARRRLDRRLKETSKSVRDLLFLDLALEDFLRVVVERNIHRHLSGDQLVELMGMVLENLCLSNEDVELTHSLRHWRHLGETRRFGREWSLQAKAVLDRLGRRLGAFVDRYHTLLQPKADFLGRAFHADTWTITLFSEEVVRGQPFFVLSMLLRHLDPVLRKSASLGSWQIISPGRGIGHVEIVPSLGSVQGKDFARPTVIVTDKVGGNEEIPEGVTAIITPDTIDIVSHVAIRARNAHVFFATCYDPEIIAQLKSFSGHTLTLSMSSDNNVTFEEGDADHSDTSTPQRIRSISGPIERPIFTAYGVLASDFDEKMLGGKSLNLRRLQNKLPEWIRLPTSVALPFGVFEKVLADENNKAIAGGHEKLIRQVRTDEAAGKTSGEVLSELRKSILALKTPDEWASTLRRLMHKAALKRPENWDQAWNGITRVWASKWNERAYLSRRARRIHHEDLFMAVLVQEVVEADYSFVIHTVNPFTGDKDEIYGEVVLGLGETLVSNYPGRALSFTSKKEEPELHILGFPSKSIGLFGSGLIFRSDSNGEDLAGYAGAGLYDSVMVPRPRSISLDYSQALLLWDENFRRNLLTGIASIGTIIEEVLQYPQDIEGAYCKGKYYVVQTRPQVGIEDE
jgi:alpha-glucan,water dikinase